MTKHICQIFVFTFPDLLVCFPSRSHTSTFFIEQILGWHVPLMTPPVESHETSPWHSINLYFYISRLIGVFSVVSTYIHILYWTTTRMTRTFNDPSCRKPRDISLALYKPLFLHFPTYWCFPSCSHTSTFFIEQLLGWHVPLMTPPVESHETSPWHSINLYFYISRHIGVFRRVHIHPHSLLNNNSDDTYL